MAEEKSNTIPSWIHDLLDDRELQRQQQRINEDNKWRVINSKDDALLAYAEREVGLATANILIFTDTETLHQERRRLAENLIILGRLTEAREVAFQNNDNDLHILTYSLEDAINKPDTQKCDCEDLDIDNRLIDRHHVLTRIFSPKHKRVVPVMRCSRCETLNASPNIHSEG